MKGIISMAKRLGRVPVSLTSRIESLREATDQIPRRASFAEFPEIRRLWARGVELLDTPEENPYYRLIEKVDGPLVVIDGEDLVNFASYDYLGLSEHPEVTKAASKAIEEFGLGTNASRIVSGQRPAHLHLEKTIANFMGFEDALAFVSGFGTNESVIGHLMGAQDLILIDDQSHRSIREGASLSGARVVRFRHNDCEDLRRNLELERGEARRALIIVEGLYSMDGDIPDLASLVELKNEFSCLLMVDEAHSLGVLGPTGRGISEMAEVPPSDIDIVMGTLSKTCGGCGGFVAGCQELIFYLRYTTPGFVFSVGMPPSLASAAATAIEILDREPERVAKLRANSKTFYEGLMAIGIQTETDPRTPIFPVVIGDSRSALSFSRSLEAQSIFAPPILHPAVPRDSARIRFFLSSSHTQDQIGTALNAIHRSGMESGIIS
ncbi:MAG: aminotransferase class I/II-fold pyridoxal phosphate-dependent enzyme [Verrucomicrobiota bacterium]